MNERKKNDKLPIKSGLINPFVSIQYHDSISVDFVGIMNDPDKSFGIAFRHDIPVTSDDGFDVIFSGQKPLREGAHWVISDVSASITTIPFAVFMAVTASRLSMPK